VGGIRDKAPVSLADVIGMMCMELGRQLKLGYQALTTSERARPLDY
jgi:hypothetical protein